MKHLILTLLLSSSVISCVTLTKQQLDAYEKSFVIETKMKKNQIFSALTGFLAKNLNDSNKAGRVSDKEMGKLVTRYGVTCPYKNGGVNIDIDVTYNLTALVKDKKFKLTLKPIKWVYNNTDMTGVAYSDHINDTENCTTSIKKSIEKSLNPDDFNF